LGESFVRRWAGASGLNWEPTLVGVRASPSEYLALELRVHDLLRHVPYPAMLRRIRRAWREKYGGTR